MKKLVFLLTIVLMSFSCNYEQKSNVTQSENKTQQKASSILNKVEVSSIKTGLSDHRATVFYPVISMKVKNISNETISHDILISVIFINKSTQEQLSNELDLILEPFESQMSKKVTLRSTEGITFLGKDLIGALEKTNLSCRIYINKQFYKEVDIETKPFM